LNRLDWVDKGKAGLRRASGVCQFGCAGQTAISASRTRVKREAANVLNVCGSAGACTDGASGSELDAGFS
jgi:hypothetical protein